LIGSVEANLVSRGSILIAGKNGVSLKNDFAWVVIDVNWLTRDVMGTIIKNMTNPTGKRSGGTNTTPTGFKLGSSDINNLTETNGGTAKCHFNDDESILPLLLHKIGACIPAKTSGNECWFPIFSRNPPSESSCQPSTTFSRLIFRLFRIKEADTHMFPPGYFPKLFVAILSQFDDIFESIEIFEGAMDLRFARNSGNIQVVIRKVDELSFYLVVTASNTASSLAWIYYLKIIALFHRTSTMFTYGSSATLCWEHGNIELHEICYNLKYLPENKQISCDSIKEAAEAKGGVYLLSTIEKDIKVDDNRREQMLVYLYGIKKEAVSGEIVHVDEDA
jgi:hypothetical protein